MMPSRPAASMALDLVFESDKHIACHENKIARWGSNKDAFFNQPELLHQPRYIPDGLNHYPTVQFNGMQFLNLLGFSSPKGLPHTVLFVIKPKYGFILDIQQGPLSIDSRGISKCWQILEWIAHEAFSINGTTTLGADIYGLRHFFGGEVAFLGYKQGMLEPHTRQNLYDVLKQKYTLKDPECTLFSRPLQTVKKLLKR